MGTTREQALKGRDTNLAKDPNYYSVIGAKGGETVTENTHKRGVGSLTPEQRRLNSQRALKIRWDKYRASKAR